jgi:putative MFS transporter
MKRDLLNAGQASAIGARMDRLPSTRYLWLMVTLISLGGFFEVYDLVFTGYIAPGMAKSGLFATTTASFFGFKGIGAFIASTFAGLFIGTFCFGFLPDRFGRRSIFTISLLWYSIGSAIMAFQTTTEGVLLWRFITGIGVGVEIVTIDVFITEMVPHHMRGRAMASTRPSCSWRRRSPPSFRTGWCRARCSGWTAGAPSC